MLKPSLRPLYHFFGFPFGYLRAEKISRDYSAHYRAARGLFGRVANASEPRVNSFPEVGVRVVAPGAKEGLLDLPKSYHGLIARIHNDVSNRFEESKNCFFFPKVEMEPVPQYTSDVTLVQRGDLISIQLKEYVDIDGLEELCAEVMTQVERRVYGSHILVDKVYLYRSLPTHQQGQVSWLWHFDNHPNEILKIMIYLTAVDEDSGPFEYLLSVDSGSPAYISPRPLLGHTRMSPKTIKRYLADGYERQKVKGPRGTMILFDNNVVHRANLARASHRDVVVLQIRPATFRPQSYINARWTGSFQHVDFNPDPWDYQPRPKSRMLSG